ncbi:MAG: phage holin family protein [Microbacteriaceae bacterium]
MSEDTNRRGFFRLLADLPRELSDLVRAEIRLLQTELASKLRAAGVGLGLVTLGVTLISAFLLMLVVAGILALSLVMPGWAAALIIAGSALLIGLIFIAAGIGSIKKGFTPFESVDQIAADFKDIGKRDSDE